MARPVPVWKIKPEYEADIVETLENHFGELEDKAGLESALISAAQNAAGDNLPDYLSELLGYKPDSYLEEFDDLNIGVMYRRLVENSVAYMLLYRCGYVPDQHFAPQDFSDLFYFNTPNTINTLGVATSAISERALSTIALTVRNLQKEEKKEKRTFARKGEIGYADGTDKNLPAERSFEYDLHDEKRLPSARPAASPGTGGTPWEIRPAAPPVMFTNLLTTGRLNEHLMEIQQTAQRRVEQITAQMAKAEGVTEELKARDQMQWVGRMNNLKQAAEETVMNELIYS